MTPYAPPTSASAETCAVAGQWLLCDPDHRSRATGIQRESFYRCRHFQRDAYLPIDRATRDNSQPRLPSARSRDGELRPGHVTRIPDSSRAPQVELSDDPDDDLKPRSCCRRNILLIAFSRGEAFRCGVYRDHPWVLRGNVGCRRPQAFGIPFHPFESRPSGARSSKRVISPRKVRRIFPDSPLRCFSTRSSARPPASFFSFSDST